MLTPTPYRPRPVLPLLAGDARLLRRQLVGRGRGRQEEVRAPPRGLLRVPASQEGGRSSLTVLCRYYSYVLLHLLTIQAARVRTLQAALRKADAATPRDAAPNAGQIRNLGLLGKEEDTQKVLGSS